jgi:hypothetical protein
MVSVYGQELRFTIITSKGIYIRIISDFDSEVTYSLVIRKLYITNDKTTTTQHDLPFSDARLTSDPCRRGGHQDFACRVGIATFLPPSISYCMAGRQGRT